MSIEDAKTASLVTGGVFFLFGLIVLFLMCCACNAINTACACVEAACDAIVAMPCMLLWPLIEMTLKVILFTTLIGLFTFLVSAGDMTTKTFNNAVTGTEVYGLRRSFEYEENTQYMIFYYIFGIFWVMELANALGQYTLSHNVVRWYYTPKDDKGNKAHNWFGLLVGFGTGCTVHLGSLALGSFCIAVFRVARLICWAIEKQAQHEGNVVLKILARVIGCCLDCFRKFFEFMNKNAYIDIAITSNNFCGAGRDVMGFLATQGATIAILNGACTIFSIGGMMLISGLTSYGTYMAAIKADRWADDSSPHHVQSPRFVAIVTFIFGLFIAAAFMVIFDHTADTLLYTYCYNKNKGHNTVGKYAPASLAKLVDYKPLEKPKSQHSPKKESGGGGFGSWFWGSKHEETVPLVGHGDAHGHGGGHH
jgi:hypothetical protein